MQNVKSEIEQIFNKPPASSEQLKKTKPIPKDWYPNIISLTSSSIRITPISQLVKIKEKTIIFEFKSEDERKNFYKEFVVKLFPSVNNLIISKKEKPEDYNRNIVYQIAETPNTIIITY